MAVELNEHLQVVGSGLKRWLVAQTCDSLAVGTIWLAGLLIIGVPWALLWAFLGGMLQFIPHFGPACALIGPAIAAVTNGGLEQLLYVLILYAFIAVTDGFLLQPYFMKRTAKVPIWASIVVPIVLGILFSFWGVLVSAPLLAVVYVYRAKTPRSC
jgi:predicted PurR-regulated permease PerM